MATSIVNTPGFDKMMQTVGVLRTHYSRIANMAETEMLKARLSGKTAEADKYADLLDSMAADHRSALQLIADNVTTPDELKQTRRALRSAADEAHDFVEKLKKTKLTLAKLADAAKFLTGLVKGLTSILT